MRIEPASRIAGILSPPPDKSISHRAALLAAMSEQPVVIRNYLRSGDTARTAAAAGLLGARVEQHGRTEAAVDLTIHGVGLRGARQVPGVIDVGNAGTLLRLLPGWLAGQPRGRWTLDGDESIRRRPVDRIVEPLGRMGASVECRDGRWPPLVLEGASLKGITYELPVASAQVKSCLLLAALLADGETVVVERLPTRDHTEIMLRSAGVDLNVEGAARGESARVSVRGPQRLDLGELEVPGDLSSAAFFIAAATIVRDSALTLKGVGVNPTRTGLLAVMERMGAQIEVDASATASGEPVADLAVRHAELLATSIGADEVPRLIDELPLVALLGAFASGTTVVSGAGELRHKESDRIATVVGGLAGLGVQIEATDDGFVVEGGGGLRGGAIEAAGDHRLAMLGAVAGLASKAGVEVNGFEAASVSYPGFAQDLAAVAVPG